MPQSESEGDKNYFVLQHKRRRMFKTIRTRLAEIGVGMNARVHVVGKVPELELYAESPSDVTAEDIQKMHQGFNILPVEETEFRELVKSIGPNSLLSSKKPTGTRSDRSWASVQSRFSEWRAAQDSQQQNPPSQ